MAGFREWLGQFSDLVVQAGIVSYMFLYFLLKGRSELEDSNLPIEDGSKPKAPSPSNVPSSTPTTQSGESGWIKDASGRLRKYESLNENPLKSKSPPEPTTKLKQSFESSFKSSSVTERSIPQKPPASLVSEVKDFIQGIAHPQEPRYPGGLLNTLSDTPVAPPTPNSSVPPPPPCLPTSGAQRSTIVSQKFSSYQTHVRKSPLNAPQDEDRDLITPTPMSAMTPEPQTLIQEQYSPTPEILSNDPAFNEAEGEFVHTVQAIKKQWPPPSNATGPEVIKDMWMPGQPLPSDYTASAPSSLTQQSSYQSTGESEGDLIAHVVRNPQGDLLDFEKLSRRFGGDIGSASPERSRELSASLSADRGRALEMFSRQRENAEKYTLQSVGQTQPPFQAPQPKVRQIPIQQTGHLVQRNAESSRWASGTTERFVSPLQVAESVREAAARKDNTIRGPSPVIITQTRLSSVPVTETRVSPVPEPRVRPEPVVRAQAIVVEPVNRGRAPTRNFGAPEPPPRRMFSPDQSCVTPTPVDISTLDRLFSPTPYDLSNKHRVFSPPREFNPSMFNRSMTFSPPGSRPFSPASSVATRDNSISREFGNATNRVSQFGVQETAKGWSVGESPSNQSFAPVSRKLYSLSVKSSTSGTAEEPTVSNTNKTTSTLQIRTPSKRIVSTPMSTSIYDRGSGAMQQQRSVTPVDHNSLPRSWKSFSQQYHQ